MSKEINWLTTKEIKQAAKKGRKPAFESGIVHWWQLHTATQKQLLAVHKKDRDIVFAKYCALCIRGLGKRGNKETEGTLIKLCRCPLGRNEYCCEKWREARSAFDIFIWEPTRRDFRLWRKTSSAMLDKIIRIYKQLYPKTYDKELVAK